MDLLNERTAIVSVIILFAFLGCALNLLLKKPEDGGISAVRSIFVQIIGWAFTSLVISLLYLKAGWAEWICLILALPAALVLTRSLVLGFEDANKQTSLQGLISWLTDLYEAYKKVKEDRNKPTE